MRRWRAGGALRAMRVACIDELDARREAFELDAFESDTFAA